MIRAVPRWLGLSTLLYGVTVFLWTSPEEQTALFVSLLGWIGATLIVLHIRVRWVWFTAQSERTLYQVVMIPIAVGILAVLSTCALMFIKTALHNHLVPEYPLSTIVGMLSRIPAWCSAAILMAASLRLWRTT